MIQKKPLLLIVEDDADQRALYENILSSKYDLIFAKNGQEAIKFFSFRALDLSLILLDLHLPDMTGYQIVEQFEAETFPGIPNIVVVSSESAIQDVVQTMTKINSFYHLGKPFTKEPLLKIIETALSKPMFTRKGDWLMENLEVDNILSYRYIKLQAEIVDLGLPTDPDYLLSIKKDVARNRIPLKKIISLLEEDTGKKAPEIWQMKILIVEDDEDIADSHIEMLNQLELSVCIESVGTLAEAKEKLVSQNDFDLILLDLGLPDGRGDKFIEEIRNENIGSSRNMNCQEKPTVVVISSNQDHEKIAKAIQSGAYTYILKSMDKASCKKIINYTLLNRYSFEGIKSLWKILDEQKLSFRHLNCTG